MKKHLLILLIAAIFLIYFSPFIVLREKIHLPLRDNLHQINQLGIFDGKMQAPLFPWQKTVDYTLPNTSSIFHYAHPKFDKLLFSFSYFWGYFLNEIFMRFLAFIGFFFLTKQLKLKQPIIRMLLSTAFATLPFWPQGNLSIAGLPLLVFFYHQLLNGKKPISAFFFIIFYAFYSNFFYAGIFIFGLLIISNLYFSRNPNKNLIWTFTGIYLLSSILSHWPVFLNFLIYHTPTNRAVQKLEKLSLWSSIKTSGYIFLSNQILSPSHHLYLILPTSLAASLLIIRDNVGNKLSLLWPWIPLFIFSGIAGFFFYNPFLEVYEKTGFGFNFSRIYILNAFIWYLLFALTIRFLSKKFPTRKANNFLILIISLQIMLNSYNYLKPAYSVDPSFRDFFAKAQFLEIKNDNPGLTDSRVGCVGLFPAVANYNGLMTIDSFSAYYPLDYKNRFRQIIQPVLDKDDNINSYFENKGSALYLFDEEIGTNLFDIENRKDSCINLDLNFTVLRLENVKYIISIKEVNNKNINLEFRGKYPGDYYDLYLYKIR